MKYILGLLCLVSFNTLAIPPVNTFDYASFNCLVENAYQEARGEGKLGMQLVVQVVKNRELLTLKDACTLIHIPYQFSWTLRKDNQQVSLTKRALSDSRLDARLAVGEWLGVWPGDSHVEADARHLPLKIYRATHYHEKGIKPYWVSGMRYLGRYKNHMFYERWENVRKYANSEF